MRVEEITLERELPLEQAFGALREATLEEAGDRQIFFYRDATLRLEALWPENLNPAAMYLLEEKLDFQRKLRRHLLDRYGIDTLRLSSVLHLRTRDPKTNEWKIESMVPPYVEISEETLRLLHGRADRKPPERQILRIPILIDGLHRARIALEEELPLNCIVASGSYDTNYLYASYPVHWSQVKIYDEVPKLKKHYRRQDKYSFMRPLEALRLTDKGAAGVGGEYGR